MIKQTSRIIFCFLLLGSAAFTLRAQVVMTTQLPPVGVTQKTQLWNLLLSNTSTGNVDLQIELSLLNLQTNQTVLSGTGRRFTLVKGAKVVQWGDVQPVVYNAAGSSGIDANPNGFLPAGNYKVCYNLMRYLNDMKEVIGEECTDIEIAPLNPPQLTLPADGDTLETTYPQFSWMPPVPANLFQRLTYEIRVVELLPGQSQGEAIQNNLPFFNTDNLAQALYTYPSSAKGFEAGKDYLWQVTAKDINQYAVKTEVWRFHLKKNERTTPVTSVGYTRLTGSMNSTVMISGDVLRVAYFNQAGDSTASYNIYAEEKLDQKIGSGIVKLKQGENFLDIPIEAIRKLRERQRYWFEVVSSRGERRGMQFTYEPKTTINK